jgi:hypothetical protein
VIKGTQGLRLGDVAQTTVGCACSRGSLIKAEDSEVVRQRRSECVHVERHEKSWDRSRCAMGKPRAMRSLQRKLHCLITIALPSHHFQSSKLSFKIEFTSDIKDFQEVTCVPGLVCHVFRIALCNPPLR